MKVLATALTVVLIVMVVLSAWRALPALIWLLAPLSLRIRFEDPLAIEAALSGPPDTRAWVRDLREAGFLVMGIRTEKMPLWGREAREVAMVSDEANAFASIVLRPDGTPVGLYLHTPLLDGASILTTNAGDAPLLSPSPAGAQVIQGADLSEVLRVHHLRVQESSAGGAVARLDHTPEARIHAARELYRRQLRLAAGAWIVQQGILTFLLAALLLVLAVAWWSVA